MCGVAGAFLRQDAAFDEGALVASLCQAQSTRGPDGEGTWRDAHSRLCLGHRRLAIIETGQLGYQPMADVTGRYLITFNGEIYNYKLLRAELIQLGERFNTFSDTEVIVAVFARWGAAGFSRLRGMFAFAIWDTQTRQLCIARDPFGIKPLYVAEQAKGLCFASSARALAQLPLVDGACDPAAFVGFYLWGHVPEPFTWWMGIKMLPPGHYQFFSGGCACAEPQAFDAGRSFAGESADERLSQTHLRSALDETVEAHLVADVPVGLFLSAGIDSSAIAMSAARLGYKPVALTLSFESYTDPSIDEVRVASNFARSLGLAHEVFHLSKTGLMDKLDAFLAIMDQPTIDGFNAYLVSEMAAEAGLKVALCGVGSDEIFGGYPSFKQIPPLLAWSKRLPMQTCGDLLQPLAPLAKLFGLSSKVLAVPQHSGSVERAYLLRRSLYLEQELEVLQDASWLRAGRERLDTARQLSDALKGTVEGATVHAQISVLESRWYLRNQLLRDWDWAGMAHSIEIRTPFVDVDFVAALDPYIGSHQPPSKADLALAAGLPNDVSRRPKTGFTTPLSQTRNGLKPWADRVSRTFSLRNTFADRAPL